MSDPLKPVTETRPVTEVNMRSLVLLKDKWVRSSVRVVRPFDRSRLKVEPLSC